MKLAALSPAAADPVVRAALGAEDVADWFAAMPWRRGLSPLRHAPEYEAYLFDQWERGAFDDYWQAPELYAAPHYATLAKVPVFLISGWFDPDAETMLEHYKGWRAHGGHAELVLGRWLHGRRSNTFAGDADFGAASVLDGQIAPDYETLRIDWFRRWLLGDGALASQPAARWFAMGSGSGGRTAEGRRDQGGRWRSDPDWPPAASTETDLHLAADGALWWGSSEQGEAILCTDPSDPVPTIGGAVTSGEPVMEGGAFDQLTSPRVFGARPPYLPLAARADVIVFSTAPLDDPVEIAGPVTLSIELETDVPDLDLTAKLIDWAPASPDDPKGYAVNLSDGMLRLRYRDDWAAPSLLEPGRCCRSRRSSRGVIAFASMSPARTSRNSTSTLRPANPRANPVVAGSRIPACSSVGKRRRS